MSFWVALYFTIYHQQSKDKFFSIFLLMTMLSYSYILTNIRQGLSIALIFLAYHLVTKKHLIRAGMSILLASIFHTSALIFILVFPLSYIKLNKWSLLGISIVSLPLYVVIPSLIVKVMSVTTKYESYLESSWFLDGNKISLVLRLVMIVLIFLAGEWILRDKKLSRHEHLLRNIIFVGVLFSFFNMNTALISRFTTYFSTFMILYLPLILQKIDKRYIQRTAYFLMILLFATQALTIMIFKPEWNVIVPYENVVYDWFSSFF